jgi:hypothetical protein
MKKVLMTLALLATTTSYAKLAVYSNTSALQAVLNDTETMSKLSSKMIGAELTNTQIISSGEGLTKNFTVRMTYTAKTPIGDRSCYTDVAVISRPGSHKLPGGAVIGVNELVVGKTSKSICEK